MRILTRYILREVLSHGLLGGVVFTFVLFMPRLSTILGLVVRGSASVGEVTRFILYTLPSTLILTIPMAVLVGILLGLSRLASDSEITAMRASGFGVMSFVRVCSIATVAALLVGLVNALVVAPRSAAALLRLETELKTSQASYEVQPRVFYEDFKNYVLYVQDTHPVQGAALWEHVFLADLSQPASPYITTAEQAVVVNGAHGLLRLHLRDGSRHEISPKDPNQYDISTFADTDTPIQTGENDDIRLTRNDTPLLAVPVRQLWQQRHGPQGRQYTIELNKRFSYPVACIVLMLVGVPLGLSSRRGGKGGGFVATIGLVFIYYFFSSTGVALAKQGKLSPFLGVWTANILFAILGNWLLHGLSHGDLYHFNAPILRVFAALRDFGKRFVPSALRSDAASPERHSKRAGRSWRFPLIFDSYVVQQFLSTLALVLLSFITLSLFFSFFELLGDIIRNRTALVTVGDYLLNLIPYMVYNLTPLCALLAVLITFGALSRSSELTAMKASGVSIYRLIAPVMLLTAVIAMALFAFDEFYLPTANRRQESLRSVIKGKPAQTFQRPDRKWISGQQDSVGQPARIFYYQFFDPDKDVFANLTVFEFQPGTFRLQRRIFAAGARWDQPTGNWVFENGWQRTFQGETVSSYQPFTLSAFPEIREQPTYFKKEERPSQEMSYAELGSYIRDLKQSGFDTMRLRVQLNRKLAYPLITLVMALLAVPFALTVGKRGGLAGVATAIAMAILYTFVSGIFESMGNVNALPPTLAAWSPDLLFALAGGYLLLRTPT